jgi:hypothetical protein
MVRTRIPQIWKLSVEDQPSGRQSPVVRTRESLIWKLLAADVRLSGRGSQTGKIFSENLRNSVAQLSVRTAHVHCPDGVRTYYSSRPFEPSAYK